MKRLNINAFTLPKVISMSLQTLLLTLAVSACGGDSDTAEELVPEPIPEVPLPVDPTTTIDDEFGFWLTDLANNHILPSYENLERSSALLSEQSNAFCGNETDEELAILQQSWRTVMADWQIIQWLKIGPIDDNSNNFRVQRWPDANNIVTRDINNLLSTTEVVTEAFIAQQSVGAQGLPGLEQLLFASEQNNLLNAADKNKRCEVLLAITANVATISEEVNSQWQIAEGNYHLQLTSGTGDFSSKKDAVEELVTNLLEQIESIKDQKMQVPLTINSPGISTAIEHQLSGESLVSIQNNIVTLRTIYTAGSGHGFDDILINFLGQQNIATEMLAAIDNAINESNALAGDYETLLATDEGRAQIELTIEALALVRTILTADFVQAIDINIGFNSNDGD
jgi:predicted lipoprotein